MLTIIFFHCTRFTNKRLQMIHSTRNLHPLNCQLLLFSIEAWNAGQNIEIVEAVHNFIKRTILIHSFPSSIHTLLSLFPTYFLSLY